MDELAGVLLAVFAILVAIGFIGYGLAWVVVNLWPYLIVAGVLALAGLVLYFRHRSAKRAPREQAVAVRAAHQEVRELAVTATRTLEQSRQAIEREVRELGDMRAAARRDLGFKVFADRHFASLRIGDSWYQHKRSAMTTRKRVSKGLDELRESKRRLARLRDGSRGAARASAVEELRTTQSVIDSVYQALSALSDEISRGEAAVTRHNQETARLRDYIRDNFGAGGRAWYANLQARKRARAE